jgi:hypothetical protein
MDIPISFIWIILLFEAVFKYDDGAKFGGNVGINAEPLCVELCYFVQCRIFVNYLTSAINEWKQLVDLYEIQYGGHVIEGNLDVIHFNSVLSSISKWRSFKLLRWMKNLHQSTWDHGILYADRSLKYGQLLTRPCFSKTKNMNVVADWKLKFIFFYGDNSWTVAVSQMKFGVVENHGHTYKFYFIYYF